MRLIFIIIKSIFIFPLFLFWENASGSPQFPDYIIYKGDTIPIYNLILEQYFENIKAPNQGDLFGLKFRNGASSNCWRGYQAIYSIESDSLFLNDIIIYCGELYNNKSINQDASKKRMIEIFGGSIINGKVFLEWYTGEFSLPKGQLLRWDGVFSSTFEDEMSIKVNKGKIKSIVKISNYIDHPNKINRKYQDTLSNIIFKELEKIKWKEFEKFDCSEKYLITIDKNGEISNVSMEEYQTKEEIREFWDKSEYNYCIKTILKALKELKFDIIKMNEKPIKELVYIEIWIGENGKLENWTN